jgi:Xaa-Pro aminopeptidase
MNTRYNTVNPELFIKNRKKLYKLLKKNSLAIFQSNDEMLRNGDCFFPFRQDSNFFYFSGIEQEKSILLLFPDCRNPSYREILFIRKTSEKIKIWEGAKYSKKEATNISGIKTVFWLENFDGIFKLLTNETENIYVDQYEHDRVNSEVDSRNLRFTKKLKNQLPAHNFERITPIAANLREIKSSIELDLIKEACDITEKGFRRVLEYVEPGVWEYEVEAEVTHEFIRNKSNGHSYSPIFASGSNACILHYIKNNQLCNDGDLILMDFGAEYANYASDLTRTIPVNGRFTKRQKNIYNSVRKVMIQAIQMLRVGAVIDEFNKEVGKFIESELIHLNLLSRTEVKTQDKKNPLYKKFFSSRNSTFFRYRCSRCWKPILPAEVRNAINL